MKRRTHPDLFRYYDDWSIVIIDTEKIPAHKFYIDFLSENDPSSTGSNKHVLTFEAIPSYAIIKIVK